MKKRIKQKFKGFTLIELLVVIAIIGLLASIVLVSVQGPRVSARDAKRLADMKQIQLALALYYDSNDETYPGPTSSYGENSLICGGWDTSREDLDGDGRPFIEPLIDGGFMAVVPVDPLDPSDGSETGCGRYNYYRYGAGSSDCDASRGNFFVLGVIDMETSGNPHPDSPGWSCPSRDWQGEFDWVVGGFER